jgi:esterase/lipase
LTRSTSEPWLGRRWVKGGLASVVLVAVALLGPRASLQERWIEPDLPSDLDVHIAARERAVPGIRPGDERGIAWAHAPRSRTPLSLVYLHGFSADRHEVEPLVSHLAATLGANAYFSRLRGHGRNGAAMAEATVEDWFEDTAEAVAIGSRLGERVVLVGTSTGGTLAAWAATRPEAATRLAAVVLISPNFHPADSASRLLLWPWGGLIARIVVGRERCFDPANLEQERHWTTCYPTRALLPMMALVEHVRTMDLSRVSAPTLIVYSPADLVVDAAETDRVVAELHGTRHETFVYEGASDPSQHVLAGDIMAPESTDAIAHRVLEFLERNVGELGR